MYKMIYLCILNDFEKLNVKSQITSEIPRNKVVIANKARIFNCDLFKECKVKKHQFFDKITCDKQDKKV